MSININQLDYLIITKFKKYTEFKKNNSISGVRVNGKKVSFVSID